MVAVAAALQLSSAGPPQTPVVTVNDPAGEIPVTELAVSGDIATGSNTLSEPISLAGLPLE
ncbi:MAG: hypothetical protein ACPGRZ_01695 [Alphaproteobacteria bacterium]